MSATLRETGTAGDRVAASNAATEQFFVEHSESIARACQAMAACFAKGGRLLVVGEPAFQSDVAHVVVEFLHPVIVGKRALPAIAAASPGLLEQLRRPGDIILRLRPNAALLDVDIAFEFVVPSDDPCIVQETYEMLYHVLWELVHVFLDHGGAR